MNPVLIVILLCALAGADQYADYAGVSMPHYSMEEGGRAAAPLSEDYPERSPDADAPIAFDYKYEEELRDKGNKLPMKFEEENWHAPTNDLKDPPNPPDDDELQKHEVESVPKLKASRKYGRHRTRIKNKGIDREEENYRQKAAFKVRSRRIDKDIVDTRNDYYTNKGRTREDNSIESEDVNFRGTTEKVIRRKPRDRRINLRRLDVDDDEDDDDVDSKILERDDVKPLRRDDMNDFARDDDAEYVQNRRAVERPSRPVSEKSRMRNKNYPVYDDDYYDMKRVKDMKNKLPDLLRRTQASTSETLRTRPVQEFNFRRANLPESTTETKTSTTLAAATTGTKLTNVTDGAASKSVTNSTDLSLAEKSRLSILKKAQRKDDVKNVAWTTKPPVLMQVTRRMQTLVMVEPPQSDVRLRAREVFDDSPQRIVKAKNLMRKKLIAGAPSIHALMDHWDEMVCDYIDVSLLDCSPSACPTLKILLLSLLSLKWSHYILT